MGLVSSNACRGYDYKWLIDLSSSRGSVRSASGRTCTLCYICMCLPKEYYPICVLLSINKTIIYVFSIKKNK